MTGGLSRSLGVHAACAALVLADFVTRTWRTQLFLRGLGRPLPFRTVFVHSFMGEAAASLTPLRLGAEPTRVWAMRQEGISRAAAIVCVGVEFVAIMSLIALMALVLGLTLAPDWWATVGPQVARSAARSGPWLGVVVGLSVVAWLLMRRLAPDASSALSDELGAARGHAREIPASVYLLNVPLTILNTAARVAILPVLALTLQNPPPLAATVVGSFALLYSQAIIPTPAGAGAVELTFLGGAAGNLGGAEASLLLAWRCYTTLVGVVGGIALAVWRYGWAIVPGVRRGRRVVEGAE